MPDYEFKYAPQYLKPDDLLYEESQTIIDIGEAADNLANVTESYYEEIKSAPDLVKKIAFDETVNYVSKTAINVLITNALNGCIETEEFNYQPFISRLIGTISNHADEMFIIYSDFDIEHFEITINSDILGNIEDYANAVQKVRDQIAGRASYKGRPLALLGTEEWRSHAWKEKLYRPAREGGTVKKIRKKKGVKNYDLESEEPQTEEVDKTQEYIQKYEQTIEERLAFSDGAPFWPILEYGHLSPKAKMSSSMGGEAYPDVRGTHFIADTEREIRALFRETYIEFKQEVKDKYQELLKNDWGFLTEYETIGEKTVELGEVLGDTIKKVFQNPEVYTEYTPGKALANKVLEDGTRALLFKNRGTAYISRMGYNPTTGKYGFIKAR